MVLESLIYTMVCAVAKTSLDGVIGNRADWLACFGLTKLRDHLLSRDSDPVLNHELQQAAHRAYLKATREMVESAADVSPAGTILGEKEALLRVAAKVKSEIDESRKSVPSPFPDLDQLLRVDGNSRASEFRSRMQKRLEADLQRWEAGSANLVARFLDSGWNRNGHQRDWHGVMAIQFMEELKADPRISHIFQAQMLARIAGQDAAMPATLEAFSRALEQTLTRIEQKVDVLPSRVADELERRGLVDSGAPVIRLDYEPVGFVGRESLLRWLESELVDRVNKCLLYGEPGTGKSVLALQLATV